MNIKKIVYVGMMLLCLCLSACKPEVKMDLYLSDIESVIGTDKVVTVPVTLNIPIPNVDQCDEYARKLDNILSPYSLNLTFDKCVDLKGEMYDLIVLNMDIELFNSEKHDNFHGLFGIYTQEHHYEGKYHSSINLIISNNLSVIMDKVKSQFIGSTKGAEFIINIKNDVKSDRFVLLRDGYINGVPLDNVIKYNLENRGTGTFIMSNSRQDRLFISSGGGLFSYTLDKATLDGISDINNE